MADHRDLHVLTHSFPTRRSSDLDVTYSCPAGWEVQGDKCKSVLSQPATPIFSCPPGYSLDGNMCSKTETQPATPNYSCPSEFTWSGTTCTTPSPAKPNSSGTVTNNIRSAQGQGRVRQTEES